MKTTILFIISTMLLVSCNSKEKEAAKAAEERRKDTAKQWNEATKDLSETYKLPEVKPRRMNWGKEDSEPSKADPPEKKQNE